MRSHSFRFALVCVVAAILLSSVAAVEIHASAETGADTCGETVELSYDDDTCTGYVGTFCDPCSNFQGVRFSLPSGLMRATIPSIRFYCKPGVKGANVEVYVKAADHLTDLVPKIVYSVGSTGWQTVQLAGAEATGDFFVFVRRLTAGTSLGRDYWNDYHRSFIGEHPTKLQGWEDGGDIMIRATILQEMHVGPGQPYAKIQEAVDAASPGLNIVVHADTYDENVTVYKQLTIKSKDGPAKTIVQTPFADRNVFTITADGVKLSGFTIQGAGDPSSGISIEGSSGCTISGNVVQDSYYGIYVSEGSTNNILLENECKFNNNGIYVDGSQNYISGNKLHGNTAPLGSAVFLSGTASGNVLRFNSITVDAGMDPAVANGPQVYNQNSTAEASAIENWWGSENAPANMTMVLSDPCLTKPPVRVKTTFTSAGEFTVDARSETSATVIKQGAGTPVVSVASFAENPAGDFKGKSLGKWVDVLLSSSDSIDQVEIRVSYTPAEIEGLKEGSLKLFWWNGQKWKVCSKTNVDKAGGFVWARLDAKSKPGPGDLGGTMFAVGISNGSSGFQWWVIPLVILIVILLLIVFRLVWVLLIKGERM